MLNITIMALGQAFERHLTGAERTTIIQLEREVVRSDNARLDAEESMKDKPTIESVIEYATAKEAVGLAKERLEMAIERIMRMRFEE